MSYDLFFTSPQISRQDFDAYFGEHPLYAVENGQAVYTNQDTGVYFSFEHDDSPSDDPEAPDGTVAFNMNYFRPHFFGLEAEVEVGGFVLKFGCKIHDPQMGGMENGPYTTNGFLNGWNNGNEFGYGAVLKAGQSPESIHTKELEMIWKWNVMRKMRQNEFGEQVFLPKVWFGQIDGAFGSIAMWPDGIPAIFPEADFFYIPRKDLAPSRFLRGKQEDFCIVPKSELPAELFEPFKKTELDLPAYHILEPAQSKPLINYVKKLQPYKGQIEGIGNDMVLNEELMAKALKQD